MRARARSVLMSVRNSSAMASRLPCATILSACRGSFGAARAGDYNRRMANTKVIVRNDGPLRIEGENIVLTDQDGREFGLAGRTVVSLCRCGQSQNKPF